MSNLDMLNEAFTELERRADAATADRPSGVGRRRRPPTYVRVAAMAATVTVVAGLAVGAVLLAPGDNSGTNSGAPPGKASTTAPPVSSTVAAEPQLPDDPDELIERFRAVLGGLATFEVTEKAPGAVVATLPPPTTDMPTTAVTQIPDEEYVGAYIAGTLTSHGTTGGFDLAVYPDEDALAHHCPDGDLGDRTCVERELPDGSRLILDNMPLQVSGGRTYGVDYLGADGTTIDIHVSNLLDPKGPSGSPKLADQPPLTIEQLVTIVTSELW